MALTLAGLRCLVAIADAGLRLGEAGRGLHLSQPSVSRQLALVEQALGFRVFVRRGRSLSEVTPAGVTALEGARRILRELDQLRQLAGELRGEQANELTLVAPQSDILQLLPPLLRTLRGRYPGLAVRLSSLGGGERLVPPEQARCDLVLHTGIADERPLPGAIPLFRWQQVAIVEHGHPLASRVGALSLEDLACWPLVGLEAERQPDAALIRIMAGAGLSPRFACSAQDVDTLKACVRAGLGLGLVADFCLLPRDRDELQVLAIEPRLPPCTAWASLPRDRAPRGPILDLLCLLAPQLEPDMLRRAAVSEAPERWPLPPYRGLAR